MRMKGIGLAALVALLVFFLAPGAARGAASSAKSGARAGTTATAKPAKKPGVTSRVKKPAKKSRAKSHVTWHVLSAAKANGKVCVRVGASESSYYRLDTKKPIEFAVHGPTQVKLIVRHLPIKGKIGRRSYTLQVERDGKSVLKKKLSAPRAARGELCQSKNQRVSASRTVRLRVSAGRHVYRLRVAEPGKAVAVRIFEQAKTRQGTRTGFKPDAYDRICRLSLGNGHTYLHYHATAEKPIRFRVTGPTQLLVRSRRDFTAADSAEARYRIEVRRDGQPAGIFSYKTRRLTRGAYRDCAQIAPSEDRRLYLSVPKGTWTYELRPADATTPGFMARILIPRSAVGTVGRAAP
jgi:hypothetical protein